LRELTNVLSLLLQQIQHYSFGMGKISRNSATNHLVELQLFAYTNFYSYEQQDTASVTSLENVFLGSAAFNQAIDTWNTESVTELGILDFLFTTFGFQIH